MTPPSSPNYRDIERIDDSLTRLDGKVDKLGDQVSELRTDTSLLVAKFDADAKQRHEEALASSRRTKALVSLIGVIISAVITLGSQLGWLTQKQAVALDHGAEQVESSL